MYEAMAYSVVGRRVELPAARLAAPRPGGRADSKPTAARQGQTARWAGTRPHINATVNEVTAQRPVRAVRVPFRSAQDAGAFADRTSSARVKPTCEKRASDMAPAPLDVQSGSAVALG